jgi:DNA-binding winged helix-turn-helix (wHTH) protein/tetratricopeptide (TPR) repeat protein/TolB-like protein
MGENRDGSRVAAFGSFRFDMDSRELRKSGIKLRLEEKPALVLGKLIESAGAVVTRDQLQKLLWPGGVHVDFNHGLNKSINRLRAALGDDHDQPRYIETLSRRGYRFVAAVKVSLESAAKSENPDLARWASRDPNNFGTQAEERVSAAAVLVPANATWWSRQKRAAAIAAVLGIVLLAVGAFSFRSRDAAASSARRSVAILGFRNLSGKTDNAWLSTALTQWLTTDLASGGQLRPVSTEQVARMRLDLALERPDELTPEMLRRIRQNSGADLVVSGYYATSKGENPSRVRVDARVQNAKTGEILDAISATGTESDVLDLGSQIGQRLRADLGVSSLSKSGMRQMGNVLPHDSTAARLYAQGLEKLLRFEVSEARQALTGATSIEPRHAVIHFALSTAWSKLGYDRDALHEAQLALNFSSGLPLESRLVIEGQLKEASHDWSGATDAYTTLFQHYPDDPEYGLRLAAVQTAAGKGMKAVDTLRQLRRLAGQDPRIDLAEAEAAASFSDFKRQQQAAATALEKSRSLGAELLAARAELAEGEALRALGDFPGALPLWVDARKKFDSVGDRSAVARTFLDEGRLRWQQGNPLDARRSYEQAIAICKAIGDDANLGRALTGLGQVQLYHGGPGEGRRITEEALSIFRRIGNRQEEAYTLSLVADSLMPHYEEAKELYTKSLELSRAANDRSRTAGRLMDLGIIATVQGDLPAATQNLRQALQIYQEIGERNRAALQMSNLAIVLRWEGKLPEAKKVAEESIAILSSVGEPLTAGQARQVLATIQLENGELADAEETLRLALQDNRQAHDDGGVAISLGILADLRLAQHRYVESRAALRQSGFDLPPNDPRGKYLLSSVMTNAQLYAAEGKQSKALEEARRALNRCITMGAGGMQMLARLTLAEIELQSDRAAGRFHLEQLERDASAKGFGLIADKARKALRS